MVVLEADTKPETTKNKYNMAYLDGLRGFAALQVFNTHYKLMSKLHLYHFLLTHTVATMLCYRKSFRETESQSQSSSL
jgi:hypothetical protein